MEEIEQYTPVVRDMVGGVASLGEEKATIAHELGSPATWRRRLQPDLPIV